MEKNIGTQKESICIKQFNPNLTPEQEIKHLKRELREVGFKADYKDGEYGTFIVLEEVENE